LNVRQITSDWLANFGFGGLKPEDLKDGNARDEFALDTRRRLPLDSASVLDAAEALQRMRHPDPALSGSSGAFVAAIHDLTLIG
jgi:hypothetical protein